MKSIETPNVSLGAVDAELDDRDDGELVQASAEPIDLKLDSQASGQRLDKVLSTILSQYSRGRIQQWIESGHVTVDGKTASVRLTMLGDERIRVVPQSAPEELAFHPEEMALNVVHEDASILVIDKPAGLVVHPAAGNWSGTLLNGLLHYLPALGGVPRAGIVHRLDKETSGLMVVAKTLEAHTDLVRQLQARTVKREYLALVWGTPQNSGKVDAAIGRHSRDRVKMAVMQNLTAKPALTRFERVAGGLLDNRPVSLMRCQLETGRTHQIRVHMQSIGFALVGDALYGKHHLTTVFPRQALHARRLGLLHPASRLPLEWTAPVPADFEELLARAGLADCARD